MKSIKPTIHCKGVMVVTIRKGKRGRNCAQTIANPVPRKKKKKTLTKSQMNREGKALVVEGSNQRRELAFAVVGGSP
jgi:hypothetical protein